MDINSLRVVMTVVAFVAFLGIVAWAYSRKRKHEFDDAARLPFDAELGEDAPRAGGTENRR